MLTSISAALVVVFNIVFYGALVPGGIGILIYMYREPIEKFLGQYALGRLIIGIVKWAAEVLKPFIDLVSKIINRFRSLFESVDEGYALGDQPRMPK